MERLDLNRINLSFCGCSFLCFYHVGVCAAIKEYAPHLAKNVVSGASAGSIAAAGLICNISDYQSAKTLLNVVALARSKILKTLDPNFNLIDMLREGLRGILPHNAHILCNGRLRISLTRAKDLKNVIIDEFADRDELIQALICSSFIPGYCGLVPPKFRGVGYWDGGWSDNQPIFDEHTITISPFSGESDICPKDADSSSFLNFSFTGTSVQFTTQNLYRVFVCLIPPSLPTCAQICRQGFEDTIRFLLVNGIIECNRCLTHHTQKFPIEHHKVKSIESGKMLNKIKLSPQNSYEECFDKVIPKEIELFPAVSKFIEEVAAAESYVYNYLYSYKLFRYSRRMMMPFFIPLEYSKAICYNAFSWATYIPMLPVNWFMNKSKEMAEFVMKDVYKYNSFSLPTTTFN